MAAKQIKQRKPRKKMNPQFKSGLRLFCALAAIAFVVACIIVKISGCGEREVDTTKLLRAPVSYEITIDYENL